MVKSLILETASWRTLHIFNTLKALLACITVSKTPSAQAQSLSQCLQSGLKAGFDKEIQITVQNLIAVTTLHTGAQIFNPLIIQHI